MFLFYGVLFCSCIYSFSLLTNTVIGGRFIFFLAFFLHLAVALYIQQNNFFSLRKIRDSLRTDALAVTVIFILLVPSGVYRAKEMRKHVVRFFDGPSLIHNYRPPAEPYFFLSKYLCNQDVVLVNGHEGWVIPAITGARVVDPLKLNPLILHEGVVRKREVARFFKSQLSLKDRAELICKYHVTHIMINLKNETDWDQSLMNDLEVIGIEKARKNGVILYKVAQNIDYI